MAVGLALAGYTKLQERMLSLAVTTPKQTNQRRWRAGTRREGTMADQTRPTWSGRDGRDGRDGKDGIVAERQGDWENMDKGQCYLKGVILTRG